VVENDPFLIQMRIEINDLEKRKDDLYNCAKADPTNVATQVHYDLVTAQWARAMNAYHDAIRAVIGL
jgi:hypothetical protein